jgi:hypothetical protein
MKGGEIMKKCKSCKSEIDSKATKCPHCQADQRGWFKRHPILTGIFGFILFFGVVGAMSGGSDSSKKVGDTATQTDTASESKPQEEATTKTFKLGELVDLEGKTVAVNAVEPYTSGNQFLMPKSGNKFVAVDITLKNNSKGPYSYNPLEFKLHDNQDYGYSMAATDKEPTISADALQPSQTTRGFIVFEIPESNTPDRPE